MIEKYVEGNDYRVCVVNNNVVAVSLRIPPFILVNGFSWSYPLLLQNLIF